MVGARSATALMLLRGFANLHCGAIGLLARNCAGRGRREHIRVGRAASSRYDDGTASIMKYDAQGKANSKQEGERAPAIKRV